MSFIQGAINKIWYMEKVSFHSSPKGRAITKNIQTVVQLCSVHMLTRLCSKSFKLCFSSSWTENFQMDKLVLAKVKKPEIKLRTFVESWRKQRNSWKASTFASLTMLKLLTVWITTNCGKFLMENIDRTLDINQRKILYDPPAGDGMKHQHCRVV